MMNAQPVQIGLSDRTGLIKRGRRLEYFTIAYNSLEGLIAVVAGLMASSIALVGFGVDSLIEVTSRSEKNETNADNAQSNCLQAVSR
jgi:hypothetical protein